MFFRKKRYSDVEGYDRISRMIEDRQAEGGEEGDDLFEDETVLLGRDARDSSREDREFDRGRDERGTWPAPRDPGRTENEGAMQESVTLVRPPERTAPRLALPLSSPPTVTPAEPSAYNPPPLESPRMSIPDLALGSNQQGTASLVARDAIWEGKLVCSGNVRIEGTLRGEIETTGTVYVIAEARVEGTVRARNVTLGGEIQGDLHCAERLEILPGGAARGEVDTGALVVHEGAFIESRFQMRREAAATS